MESYKHSCPVCGQHIEYTADYCGKRMSCPKCSHSIVFPAVPPGRGKTSPTLRPGKTKPARMGSKPRVFRKKGNEFQHWKLVIQCVVPFLIVAALLFGAWVARQNSSNDSVPTAKHVTQADPGAWQKMTDLVKADQVVQSQLRNLIAANAAAIAAAREDAEMHNQYKGNPDGVAYLTAANKRAEQAEAQMAATREAFEVAFIRYEKLGGTVDYRQQIPH
jgi:DNA-directed RNA polymerase subunit RPC12/RpoP